MNSLKMKLIILLVVFFGLLYSAHAQKVSNIRAEQRGQDIVVLYSLDSTSPCEVSLLLSQDNGATWSAPLKNVSGDIGKNISAGEKQINWKVLEGREQLVGEMIKFKVVTNHSKKEMSELKEAKLKTKKNTEVGSAIKGVVIFASVMFIGYLELRFLY